jgi:hypothetical protein
MEKINKIVELGIDIDNIEEEVFEELGVDVISIVEHPAIEESFMYFNREQFVYPTADEDHDGFVSRCMSELEGEFPDQDQRYAVCESYWATRMSEEDTSDHEMTQDFQDAVIQYAEKEGHQITPNDILIDLSKEEFVSVSEVMQGLRATDALQRLNLPDDYQAEVYYRYQGSLPERGFCKAMMNLSNRGKMFKATQIRSMDSLNPEFARKNESSYSVFRYKGGKSCKHYWQKLFVFKNDAGDRVIIVTNPTNRLQEIAGQTWTQNGFSKYDFKVIDGEQRLIYGAIMVPNRMILRRDENGEPFYVFFSRETIKKMAEKFLQQNKLHNTDVEHDGLVTTNNKLVESWVSDSMVHDKSYSMGFALPKGTWYAGFRVNDEKTWQDIKEGRLTGFSLSGSFINRFTNQ